MCMCKSSLFRYAPLAKESSTDENEILDLATKMSDFVLHSVCENRAKIVSFNIASEASYVYILRWQKFIKNAKNGPFWRVFENLKLAVKQCYQTGQF